MVSLLVASADATTVAPLSFEKLVSESSAVVYGRVSEVRSQWTADRRFIESVVSIDVIKGMKGDIGDTVAFSVPGGQVGRYVNVIPGAPMFTTGDLAVFFLTERGARLPVTTGLTQGVYRVQRDSASGAMLVMPPISDTAGRVVRGDIRRTPISLSAFEGTVRAIARPFDKLNVVPSKVAGR
ncbi:MAG: hypothetical protein ABI024_06460 [Vicinamibacterales bacterium]